MPPLPMGDGHRWWHWSGRSVDLNAEAGGLPASVRAAVLARRDAETDEDTDMAEFLTWLVEEHPPWSGGCASCRTASACEVQVHAHPAIAGWLIDRSQRLARRLQENGRLPHAA